MPLTLPAALDPWADLSDEQVVAEVLAGHTATFEALMRRHNQRLYRTARAILRNEAEAEDVMQQAYVNLCTSSAVRRPGAVCHLADSDCGARVVVASPGARP